MIPLRRNRDFVLLQAGQLLSTAGTQATQIAYPLLVLSVTHSAARAGVVGFASLAPYGLFGLLAGVAADRWNRRRLMLAADGVRVAAIASLLLAFALDRISFAQIAIVAFVEGTAFVFFNIAEVGALRSVVPARQLPDAAAAEQARLATVTLLGPSVGGVLFGLGRAWPFAADVVSYVFLLFIVVAKRQGLSSGGIGLCIAAAGACALAGSVVAPFVNRVLSMRANVLANLWLNVGIVAFVFVPSIWVLLGAVLPTALLTPALNSVVIGYRTAVTPDALVGRVSSVARGIALAAQPLGPLAAGFLIAAFTPRAAVLVFALVCAALALWATLSPSIRRAPSLTELVTA